MSANLEFKTSLYSLYLNQLTLIVILRLSRTGTDLEAARQRAKRHSNRLAM